MNSNGFSTDVQSNETLNNEPLGEALRLAGLGYPVFPLQPNSKIPRPGSHGLKDATCDPETISTWWQQCPNANLGIATQGMLVLDVDPAGSAWHSALGERAADLLRAPVQSTPRGGRHYFFGQPEGRACRNTTSKIALGVDTRADGGYVVAAPSRVVDAEKNISGNYQWVEGCELDVPPHELPEPPAWFLALLDENNKPPAAANRALSTSGNAIANGQRNSSLTSLAGAMRRKGAEQNEILALLVETNKRCHPPLPSDEVANIARSIGRYPPASSLRTPEGRTDAANGERFAAKYGDDLRWCDPQGCWYVFNGCRWEPDRERFSERRALELAGELWPALQQEIQNNSDPKLVEALLRFAKNSNSANGIRNTLFAARPVLAVLPEVFDRDAFLLNVQNGTIDLRTGKLRPHSRADFLTKICPVNFDPEATSYYWDKSLDAVFRGRQPLIDYFQRWCGYCLTGDVREDQLCIGHGGGANGKTTLIEAIAGAMGDYAMAAPRGFLLVDKHGRHPTELFDLRGRRLVYVMETGADARIDEDMVKRLTGRDKVRARKLYADFDEFSPTHKLLVGTNHKPRITGDDHAIWRRLALLPFDVTFWNPDKSETGSPDLRQDKGLPTRLTQEAAGILAWAVRGCIEWQRIGLATPPEIVAATEAYRNAEDSFSRFIDECCVIGQGCKVKASALADAFLAWCEASGEEEITQRKFGENLTRRGITRHLSGGTWYLGIGLAAESIL